MNTPRLSAAACGLVSIFLLAASPAPGFDNSTPLSLGTELELPRSVLGEPVDPIHMSPDGDRDAAREDYVARFVRRQGRASWAPIGPVDPGRPLLLVVPGQGMTWRDLEGIVRLTDEFTVLAAVYDTFQTQLDAAGRIADALIEAAPELRNRLGTDALAHPTMIAHSYGATVAPLVVDELVRRGAWGADGLGPSGKLILMDGPWRGVDVPWLLRLPGWSRVAGWLLAHNPLKKVDYGSQSTFNVAPSMKALEALTLPPEIQVDLVTVAGNPERSRRFRHWAPLNNWYSDELGKGEIQAMLAFLLSEDEDEDDLRVWTLPLWNRKVGLRHLYKALQLDRDFGPRFARLKQELREFVRARRPGPGRVHTLGTLNGNIRELTELYDAAVADVVDTFHGKHTEFMWEDPDFLPWLRARLRE